MSVVRLLVIVGPTASGKTSLAVRAAQRFDGEVISADSVQVYRGFDIGSGKPSAAERGGVPHHLLDVAAPEERFSAARFVTLADAAVAEVAARGKRPIVAGGTGLYVRALLRGLFDAPPPDAQLRREHERIRDAEGLEALRARLVAVDPDAAARINPNDFVRISRALEVHEQTGVPISTLHAEHCFSGARYSAALIGIDLDREVLRERIEARVDAMLAAGWLAEVEQLVAQGHGSSHPMGALGYRHLRAHLRGELDLEEAVRQTKRDTWRFARRQLNWFRAEPDVEWYADPRVVDLEELKERMSWT